jgi:hypothetical protein
MRTHLEFRSSAFPPYAGEEDRVTPGLYGERLAEFLVQALSSAGFEPDQPVSDDWGWCVTIRNEAFSLWVGCGRYQEHPDGFLCFIEPGKPFVRRWFRKVSTPETVERVAEALDRSLRRHPDVHGLRWWPDEEAARGVLAPRSHHA